MPKYKPVADGSLLIPENKDVGNTRIAFLPTNCPVDANIELTDLWNEHQGVFLFFNRLPTNDDQIQAFAEAAFSYLGRAVQHGAKLAWFKSTDPSVAHFGATTIKFCNDSVDYFTSELGFFDFRNFALKLASGNTANLVGTCLEFDPSNWDDNRFVVTPRGNAVKQELPVFGTIQIQLYPTQASCEKYGGLELNLEIDPIWADHIDLGLRFFSPSLKPGCNGYVESRRYPLFELASEQNLIQNNELADVLFLKGCLDPLDHQNMERTYFTFMPNHEPIQSFYRTVLGHPVVLQPHECAKLVFNEKTTSVGANEGLAIDPFYLTPHGDFFIKTTNNEEYSSSCSEYDSGQTVADVKHNFMCGLSGLEYVGLTEELGDLPILRFVANQPAYSEVKQLGETDDDNEAGLAFSPLSDVAQGSWAYLEDAGIDGKLTYYAQPDSAVLYSNNADSLTDESMCYLEVPTATLPYGEERVFPMVPYGGVSGDDNYEMRQFELQVLSPTRRNVIYAIDKDLPENEPATEEIIGTTPQGLKVVMDETRRHWKSVTLGKSDIRVGDQSQSHELRLTDVTGPLKAALQSNKLFLVCDQQEALFEHCSIPYNLSSFGWGYLNDNELVPNDVAQAIKGLIGVQYETAELFEAALGCLTTEQFDANKEIIKKHASDFTLGIDGWNINLSPNNWGQQNTFMLMKHYDKSIKEIVDAQIPWTHEETFASNYIRFGLSMYIKGVEEKKDDPYYRKIYDVINSENWNGILFVTVPMPFDCLPADLTFLAAGMDPDKFNAHHIGINITPVKNQNGIFDLENSSTFGLIDYENDEYIDPELHDYFFTVKSLRVLFENSQISKFDCECALLMNKLFEEKTKLRYLVEEAWQDQEINLLQMQGIVQRHDGHPTYSFTTKQLHRFKADSHVIEHIDADKALLVTVKTGYGASDNNQVLSQFQLVGDVDFQALPNFDAFSFGALPEEAASPTPDADRSFLNYKNMFVEMSFKLTNPSETTEYDFNAENILFDLKRSKPREESLYNNFPIKFTAFKHLVNQTPKQLGYVPIDTPMSAGADIQPPAQGETKHVYAFEFELDLGSAGALSDALRFKPPLMLAWSPNSNDYEVFCGLKLPGITGKVNKLELQKFLKLSFGEISFKQFNKTYLLSFQGIALKFLMVKFPMEGQINMLIFGDPKGQNKDGAAWYAVYGKGN